jgi:hypothetical protein
VDVPKLLGLSAAGSGDGSTSSSSLGASLVGHGSSLALAMLASKVCVPGKLVVTLYITPHIQRW